MILQVTPDNILFEDTRTYHTTTLQKRILWRGRQGSRQGQSPRGAAKAMGLL